MRVSAPQESYMQGVFSGPSCDFSVQGSSHLSQIVPDFASYTSRMSTARMPTPWRAHHVSERTALNLCDAGQIRFCCGENRRRIGCEDWSRRHPDGNCWLTSSANLGDFGATLGREAVNSRIGSSLKSVRHLVVCMKKSAGRTAANAPLALINAA